MRIENSFIPVRGVGERTERALWEAGVTHWDAYDGPDVAGSVVDRPVGERIGEFIDDGRRHLAREDLSFAASSLPPARRWRLYENAGSAACFLDIETTGLDADRHAVTTVSLHRNGETTTLVRGRDLTERRLRRALEDVPLLVTFNGIRFDVPFLAASFDLDVSTPHLDLMYPCRTLGLTGGLKRIEREVGIERDEPAVSGRDAVSLWRRYERGDERALETLVSYNRDDTVNLRALADHVCRTLHRRVFEPAVDGSPAEPESTASAAGDADG